MKVTVDPDICVGCEMCVDSCPELFEMQDDIAIVKEEVVPENLQEACRDAAKECAVEAIIIEEP